MVEQTCCGSEMLQCSTVALTFNMNNCGFVPSLHDLVRHTSLPSIEFRVLLHVRMPEWPVAQSCIPARHTELPRSQRPPTWVCLKRSHSTVLPFLTMVITNMVSAKRFLMATVKLLCKHSFKRQAEHFCCRYGTYLPGTWTLVVAYDTVQRMTRQSRSMSDN